MPFIIICIFSPNLDKFAKGQLIHVSTPVTKPPSKPSSAGKKNVSKQTEMQGC